jgi:hypothetical protein
MMANASIVEKDLAGLFWRGARMAGLAVTGGLIVALFMAPTSTLNVFWNVVIPLLPASFLISPIIWRGVCPLATLNSMSNGWVARRTLRGKWLSVAGGVGVVLLAVLVPARHFIFNTDGTLLAVAVLVLAVLALALGAVYDVRAGFCNAICPVLPVERLYGQSPLVRIPNPRCAACTVCVGAGCVDLSPTKAINQVVGPPRRSAAWLRTHYGVFAAAFPGFIVGYFLTPNGGIALAPTIYLQVALWAAGSYVTTSILVWLMKPRFRSAMVMLGGVAAGLYYWFGSPGVAAALGGAEVWTTALRSAMLALVALWFWRAMRDSAPARPAV